MDNQIIKKLQVLGDVSKFSWAEAFNGKNGKTSLTAILAAIVTIPAMFVFTATSIAALFGVANALVVGPWSLLSLGSGLTLAGVGKVMSGKPVLEDTVVPNDPTPPLEDDKP